VYEQAHENKEFKLRKKQPMKRIIFSLCALLVSTSLPAQSPSAGDWTTYGKKQLRVQFEGYSFFVPWSASGKKIKAQGVVKMKTIDEELAKHWAEEQSNPARKPEEVKGAQEMYIMTASGVIIEKGGAISKEQQEIIDGKKKKEGH
jgi:hypothetical protein